MPNPMSRARYRSPLAALAFALAVSPAAQAVDITRLGYANAGYACQGALPAFAGTLRTRPLAVANEGDAPAFVTCGFEGGGSFARRHRVIAVNLVNTGPAPVQVNCTLVDGYQLTGTQIFATYVPKSIALPPNGGERITWVATELPNAPSVIADPNVSCSLPPGTALTFVHFEYAESVGN